MDVRIYQPTKNTMQSGRAKGQDWLLEADTAQVRRKPEPLMGWTSADNTVQELRMFFDTREDAIAFATKKGWAYSVQESHARIVTPRNYVDNFKYRPLEAAPGSGASTSGNADTAEAKTGKSGKK